MVLTIAVANLKGGSGKTTTSAYLAHALHEVGLRTLGVDADAENRNLLGWQAAANWPLSVVGMAVANLDIRLPGVAGDRFEAIVIDTPPMQEHREIVASALQLATHVVMPCAPTEMEFQRLSASHQLIQNAANKRPEGQPPPVVAVLLNRCVPNAASTPHYRERITEEIGLHVLKGQVNKLERFAQGYGDLIHGALNTGYGDAVTELLDMEVPA